MITKELNKPLKCLLFVPSWRNVFGERLVRERFRVLAPLKGEMRQILCFFRSFICIYNSLVPQQVIVRNFLKHIYRSSRFALFYFHLIFQDTQQFIFSQKNERCLDFDIDIKRVYVDVCNGTRKTQKWRVDFIDREALNKWNETEPFAK